VDFLPLLYLAGFVTMMATGTRRQRIGDLAARTSVARALPVRHRGLAAVPLATVLLAAAGLSAYRVISPGTTSVYRAHGVLFDYPAGWQEESGYTSGSGGTARQLWRTAVGPGTPRDLIVVEAYRMSRAVTAQNIDAVTPVMESDLEHSGVAVQGTAEKITMAGMPGRRFQITGGVAGSRYTSTLVFAFNGTTEYYVNCQHTAGMAGDVGRACDQVTGRFRVSKVAPAPSVAEPGAGHLSPAGAGVFLMRKNIKRAVVTVTAGAAVSVFGTTGASAAGTAAQAGLPVLGTSRAAPVPGNQLWVQYYDKAAINSIASSLAVSPNGDAVYVTGGSDWKYATVAYDAGTGTQLWSQRYNDGSHDVSRSVAVSPDGSTVFVTGESVIGSEQPFNFDYATVAYDARTGAQKWAARYNGPGNGDDNAKSVTVSSDGRTVYVTGTSKGATSRGDYATVAYNAATGSQLWARRYNGPGNGDDDAKSVAASPSGHTVVVTGASKGTTSRGDYATVAYNAATGTQLWARRYNGPGNRSDVAASVRVSPSGAGVFVTGWSAGANSAADYATIAYNAATGTRKWVKRYNGPGNATDFANSLGVSPTGDTVYVTGTSAGAKSGNDYATIAYSAATGARRWVKRYNGPFNFQDSAASLAVSPTGSTLYVTGTTTGRGTSDHQGAAEYATVAYSTSTGAQRWGTRYSNPDEEKPGEYAVAVGVSPTNGTVFVTGDDNPEDGDFHGAITVAYNG
jgi:hypothetical protein